MCAQLNAYVPVVKQMSYAGSGTLPTQIERESEREVNARIQNDGNKFSEYFMQFAFTWRRQCSEIEEYEKKQTNL